ncbi:hypothetical protein NW768_002990 [Fusarium equiseti]|uniref:Uncharacterized protein n=1 Tax=Fusarium equiseti TaxID=61235 RepID=A0ABQ8RKL8_FUSEQ|nr:hypothetical protein NW768_002990 [Fusarium equiseti]
MPTAAEQEAIQQTVTDLFEGYDFGKHTKEGTTETAGTSQEESTATMTTDEAAAICNSYVLLNLDLASHAAEFARYNLLYVYSPWNQTEARPNQATTDTQPKQSPAKRERDETLPTEQPSTDRSQKRIKAIAEC